jgi:hypothetical protein
MVSYNIKANKQFGILLSSVFLIIALYSLINSKNYNYWAFILTAFSLVITFVAPGKLNLLRKIWIRIGVFIGNIVSPIFLGVIYFFTVIPTAIIMRSFGKDLLQIKLDKGASNSYWVTRNKDVGTMKNQY